MSLVGCIPSIDTVEIFVPIEEGESGRFILENALDSALVINETSNASSFVFLLDSNHYQIDTTWRITDHQIFDRSDEIVFKSRFNKSAVISGGGQPIERIMLRAASIDFEPYDTLLSKQTIRLSKEDYDLLRRNQNDTSLLVNLYTEWKFFNTKVDSLYSKEFVYLLERNKPALTMLTNWDTLGAKSDLIRVTRYYARLADVAIGKLTKDYHYQLVESSVPSQTRFEPMLVIDGFSQKDKALHFTNIQFADTEPFIAIDNYMGQSAFKVGAAIEISGSTGIHFNNCNFYNLSGYAIWFKDGSKNSSVLNSEFSRLGAGAVKIGDFAVAKSIKKNQVTSDIRLENNIIHDGGEDFPQASAILIGQSHSNTIRNNQIFDFNYTGISVGWTWGYRYQSFSTNNIIDNNHIHHIGSPYLDDLGGVYTLGNAEGTEIINNDIHDVSSSNAKAYGIYLDEGTSNIKIQNNIIHNNLGAGIHLHYGKDNEIFDNIIALNDSAQLSTGALEQHKMMSIHHNLIISKDNKIFNGGWEFVYAEMHDNVYWDMTREYDIFFPGRRSLSEWQAFHRDEGSMIADPSSEQVMELFSEHAETLRVIVGKSN